MNEIIRDIAKTYPTATPAELSNAVIQELQLAIPRAIQRLKMPEPISPGTAKVAQFKLSRMKGFRRSVMEKRQSSREKFHSELYQLRNLLDGHEVSGTSTFTGYQWEDVPYELPDMSMYDGQVLLNEGGVRSENEGLGAIAPTVDVRPLPYAAIKEESLTSRVRRFVLDDDFAKRLEDHPIFWRVVKSLEETTREFAEKTSTEWDFRLSAESDVEIPSWNRFILSMSIPVQDIDEKVRQWDLLDAAIRNRIIQLAESYPEYKAEISQFSKLLFLKMELA